MGLFDWFRRPPPITDRSSLADFIDTRSAFLVQKGIFDYVRGRAGPFFSAIITEEAFKANLEESRWKSYPHALSILAELVHSILVQRTGQPVRLAAVLRDIALEVFDRYPVPAPLGADYWAQLRKDLAVRCEQIALHPPKLPTDIPIPFAQIFFDNMPIHEQLRENDFDQIKNQLRVNVLSMHRDFMKYADLDKVVASLNLAADKSAA
jgi:hypothetical protein